MTTDLTAVRARLTATMASAVTDALACDRPGCRQYATHDRLCVDHARYAALAAGDPNWVRIGNEDDMGDPDEDEL